MAADRPRQRLAFLPALGIAASCGMMQFLMLFSDLGGQSVAVRLGSVSALAFFGATILSYADPARWWLFSLVSGWGALCWGVIAVTAQIHEFKLLLPLALMLLAIGGFLGRLLGRDSTDADEDADTEPDN
jgi:hypothetical protein